MLLLFKAGLSAGQRHRVRQRLLDLGFIAEEVRLPADHALRVVCDTPLLQGALPEIAELLPLDGRCHWVLEGRGPGPGDVAVGSHRVRRGGLTIIAGPCAVEDEAQMLSVVRELAGSGVDMLRAGAFKPRSSPYDFQGLGLDGLELLARMSADSGLPAVSEAVDDASMSQVEASAAMVQIGARNMQNYALLKRAGRSDKPILLKRGPSARIEDLLLAAEYVMEHGNAQVVLCERGIRTFSDHSRYTLDLSVIPKLRRLTPLPVIVDPSHACGDAASVAPMARAAVAAGADGVMIEVHADPDHARCDGRQALRPAAIRALVGELRALHRLVRTFPTVEQTETC